MTDELSVLPVERRIAIHEAGHAVAAWFNGCRDIEIALADANRIARSKSTNDIADDCLAVCFHSHLHYLGAAVVKISEITGRPVRILETEGRLRKLMIILAGVVAESHFNGKDINEILDKGIDKKGSDKAMVVEMLGKFHQQGASDKDCIEFYEKGLELTKKLIHLQWDRVYAIADFFQRERHASYSQIKTIMYLFEQNTINEISLELENQGQLIIHGC
ncbi:hypothetical protein A6J66_017300 [Yersinia enterocolitica]|nr:hypothetical protein A6J66_017300 [Yersinia enterocolitica]